MARGKTPIRADILLGHTHWDHIQGFPFFTPAFVPGNSVAIHGPDGSRGSLHHVLQGQMEYTYFPIELGQLAAAISYHDLNEGTHAIGGARVVAQYLNHPATTLGYRVEADGVAWCISSTTSRSPIRCGAPAPSPAGSNPSCMTATAGTRSSWRAPTS
jgi:phosphoribosyl 1,2-cyclic phosphodiesterase